jgi:aspartyl aminopeptidase
VVLKELAKTHNIPVQEFVVRNDSPCGSTIGPMLSAKLGLRTVGKYLVLQIISTYTSDFNASIVPDVGNPQLSMHSIREVGGTDDIPNAIKLFDVRYNFSVRYHSLLFNSDILYL